MCDPGFSTALEDRWKVDEDVIEAYLKWNFTGELFGTAMDGNLGARLADVDTKSSGFEFTATTIPTGLGVMTNTDVITCLTSPLYFKRVAVSRLTLYREKSAVSRSACTTRAVLMAFGLLFFSLSTQADGPGSLPEWRDPEIIEVNREPARAFFVPFESSELAKAGKPENSRYHRSLDGAWKFKWAASPAVRPTGFQKPEYDVSGWEPIPVPSNWELQGYGKPHYVNVDYVFPADEPKVPVDDNPIGSYRRQFTIPEHWLGRQVFLRFGAVNSGFYVWINGEPAGYSEDSKLPAEFNISSLVKAGENIIAVEVYQWTSGSYLEDQDFWSVSGIERSVELFAQPETHVRDFFARTSLDNDFRTGILNLDVELAGNPEGVSVHYSLLDGEALLSQGVVNNVSDARFAAALSDIKPWSAETPALYGLLIELKDGFGTTLEAIYDEIGFRRIEVVDGQLLVNGQAVTLRGVNRHEHHPVTGRVIDAATMEQDIALLKRLNFNAVRTSHYPNDPLWYGLTDRYGIYVVDEANIESHAYMGRGKDKGPEHWLGNKPYFHQSHLARVERMLERDKNHPSVILWSLGNEAGLGRAFEEAAARVKRRDPTRVVSYEGTGQTEGHDPRDFIDLYTPMYDRVAEMRDYLDQNPSKAIILYEYAHAMGNSLGGFRDYWHLIWSEPMAQGGFIWDWVDQTFLEHTAEGAPYWAYGGDYDEGRNDGNFLANGIVQPDRTLNPHAHEAKKVMQPVAFSALNLVNGEFLIQNRHDFIDLSGLSFSWSITEDGMQIFTGAISDMFTAAGAEEIVRIELPAHKPRAGREYFLTIRASARTDYQLLVPGGEVVAWEQFQLPWTARAEAQAAAGPALSVSGSEETIRIDGGDFHAVIERNSGYLVSYVHDGIEFMKSPLVPNFWRAPNDNDVGAGIPEALAVWRTFESSRTLEKISIEDSGDREITVAVAALYGRGALRYRTSYTIHNSGDIVVSNFVEPLVDDLPEFYRIGMTMTAPGGFGDLRWFGRGPHESYTDRKTGAAIGLYEAKLEDQYHDYSRPQETGNKVDVRWLAIQRGDGAGLAVIGQPLLGISALPFPYEDLDYFPGEQRHGADLVPKGLVNLNIDFAQMGLGGDNSWGFWPLEKYRLPLVPYSYSFRLRAFGATEDPGDFSRKYVGLDSYPEVTGDKGGTQPVYLGADLSYVNEMEDCGAVYRENGRSRDPFELFAERGANVVRVRLWNDADWTRYSNLEDVKRTIARSRSAGMQVLLDFHYSDEWADGDKQIIPKAWAEITSVEELANRLYQFTLETLLELHRDGLLPEMVQVGNETNPEILRGADTGKEPINWRRNALLFNAGIRAVRSASEQTGKPIKIMLHIAQPENVQPWFEAASQAGVHDFDQIGISYYRRWSSEDFDGLTRTISAMRARYPSAEIILVETAYPWTLEWADEAPNLLTENTLIAGYPATPEGQSRYLVDLTQMVLDAGGQGMVYWEPAWVSTRCSTRWGQGSHWENSTFFDFRNDNEVLPAIDFLNHEYRLPDLDQERPE